VNHIGDQAAALAAELVGLNTVNSASVPGPAGERQIAAQPAALGLWRADAD
jgi:hypothetical protein